MGRRVVSGVLWSLLLLPVMAAATALSGKDCTTCHAAKPAPAGLKNDCASCHGEDLNVAELGVTLAQANGPEAAPTPSAAVTAPGALLPGMSLPMYYDASRLGDKPNEMVLVPAGEFTMGTDERLSDEGPQHRVTLPAFYIDRYEVTNLQYKAFIDATERRSPDHFRNRTFPEGKADHPVTFVNWFDARDYCAWAGKRLPSDQEWEKAARGSDGRSFPWGNEFSMYAANTPVRWASLRQEGDTTPVGAFREGTSPYGVYDMSGNVWEWTSAWYEAYPGNQRITENYGEKYKTLKGGSWWDCSFYKCGISAPSYNRSFFSPKVKNASFGFRCAKDAS
jgi:formylglycine-generating enzyme required for sulfatase activity